MEARSAGHPLTLSLNLPNTHTPKHECWCCVQPKASPTVQLRLQDKGGQDKACCLLGAGEIHFLLTVVLHGCQPGEQDVKEESHNDKTDEE